MSFNVCKTNFFLSKFNIKNIFSLFLNIPSPSNISLIWNFGSLLGVCLLIQILTGVFLAMHYTPHVDFAFNSVEHENISYCVL